MTTFNQLMPPPDSAAPRMSAAEAPPAAVRSSAAGLGPALHHLERMMVLCPRSPFNIIRQFHNKEWWYTGAYDVESGVYLSWYFVRVNAVDKLTMTVFDPELAREELPRLNRFCRIEPRTQDPGLCLRATSGKDLEASFQLESSGQWAFLVDSKTMSAHIRIDQQIPAFTKFDNEMRDRYAIIHYCQSRASGEVTLKGRRTYKIARALTYHDHCYGRVPSRTGWHWLAVQNDRVAVTALINYGAYAQRFAQAWFNAGTDSPRTRQWVRLEQNVSFEREVPDDFSGIWAVTSTDLELRVTPQQWVTDKTKVLPVVGLFVNLAHTEAFVKVEGRVRVDGRWIDTGLLTGVMEEHHGRW